MVFLFAVLYAMVAFFAFVLMPFMYFYYEEKDEDVTTKQVKATELNRKTVEIKYNVQH